MSSRLWRMTASLAALLCLSVLVWLTSGPASAHATFNVPILSSEPCVVMTAMVPFMGCTRIVAKRTLRSRR